MEVRSCPRQEWGGLPQLVGNGLLKGDAKECLLQIQLLVPLWSPCWRRGCSLQVRENSSIRNPCQVLSPPAHLVRLGWDSVLPSQMVPLSAMTQGAWAQLASSNLSHLNIEGSKSKNNSDLPRPYYVFGTVLGALYTLFHLISVITL